MNFFAKNEWTIAIRMKFPIIYAISQKWLPQPPPPSRPSSPTFHTHLQIGHQHHQNNNNNNNNSNQKKKKKKNRRSEQACLIWKRKRTRECFWRIEDQPSMKSDGYTHLFFFFFLLSLSLSLWVSFSHTTPSATSQIHIIIVLQICFLALFTKSRGGSKASSDFKK